MDLLATNYRQIPIGLVVPRDAEDAIAAVAACRKFSAPVLPRGGGTSLAGQCCNVAVVLDFTKYMNGIFGALSANGIASARVYSRPMARERFCQNPWLSLAEVETLKLRRQGILGFS